MTAITCPLERSNPSSPGVVSSKMNRSVFQCKALWDTGASMSAVSKTVVERLGLVPIGTTQRNTINGVVECYVYVCDMDIGDIEIRNLRVHEFNSNDYGVLVGMDIINSGDFSITGEPDCRVFSFRVPSCGVIDYCKEGH